MRLNIHDLNYKKYKQSIRATATLHWFGKNESLSQSGCLWKVWRDKKNHERTIKPVPSRGSELMSGNIHSGQLLRGMHKKYTSEHKGGGGEFSKRTR